MVVEPELKTANSDGNNTGIEQQHVNGSGGLPKKSDISLGAPSTVSGSLAHALAR
jgi:hypothetical protein